MNDSERPISYQPTEGLSYDPEETKYWERDLLAGEIERAFEICHGCRMCFKFCDSFPILFKLLDEEYEGDVRKVSAKDTEAIMGACFQCKLCEVQCPYTPRDGHEFQLDFPKLVHRYKAVTQAGREPGLREKLLANPDTAGALGRASFGIANAMNRNQIHRWFMEKLLGIHKDKQLPDFASETFEHWAEREGKVHGDTDAEAVLFQGCYVQNNEPDIGKDTLEVLEKNQVNVTCVKGLECCGMPSWESGDLETLRRRAEHNLEVLLPYVDAGAKIVVLNPTCSMMMRREYPELLAEKDRERASRLSRAITDPGEFLWSIRNEERFCTDFVSTPGKVAYHAPCHLRAQGVGFKGRDLLRKIPGVTPTSVIECCGHDGTYAMKVEGFEASIRAGRRAFEGMSGSEAEVWATDCPLAAIQFEQHAGKKPLHPMTILARAYRKGGFDTPVEAEKEDENETSST